MFHDEKHTQKLQVLFSSLLNEFMGTSAIARAAQSRIRNGIEPSETRLDLLRDNQPIPPRPSPDLGYRVAKSGGQMQLGQFISAAIFLLSNHLHDYSDGDGGLELLCSLLDRDAFLTTTLLQSHAPSVRASWESLLHFSMGKRRKHTFRALADIGIRHHWLNARRPGLCLRRAIEMDCYDIASKIVVYCCKSGCSHWWRDSLAAILEACRKGNIECASLLIQHCNVNARRLRSRKERSMFQELVANLDSSNDEYALALDLFLVNGADVDKDAVRKRITRRWRILAGRHELLHLTRPTILDEIFYMNRSLFNKARPYSKVPVSEITRTGLLLALEESAQVLRNYLSVRLPRLLSYNSRYVQPFLELLLAEQFRIPRKIDLRIVQGLLEFGVDFTLSSIRLDNKEFWTTDENDTTWHNSLFDIARRGPEKAGHFEFAWHQFANVKERMGLLNMLLTQGGVIGEHVLEGVVAKHGTGELEFPAISLPDFPTKAVRALVRAARSNNFEDVEFLLRKGVDPNAFIISYGLRYSVLAVATQASFFEAPGYELPNGGCSLEMIQFLISQGARLVVTPEDLTPFDFANHLLREGDQSDLFAKFKYVLSKLMEDKTSSRPPSFLLEACLAPAVGYEYLDNRFKGQRLAMFEYLFRQGAEVSPGSPLTALINADGREELVRDVLHSGSDLNASWANRNRTEFTPLRIAANKGDENLVRLFLREGANVNSATRHGLTALHAICAWFPANEEEHQRKMRICLLLIEHGADINPVCSEGCVTILGEAASRGDLELAALLLREGADVNATSEIGTALDRAAGSGRLEMVKFLLSANALSCVRGANGYDGAIYRAEKCGRLAVADLIREHAAKVEAGTMFNPELWKPQAECRVHGFGLDNAPEDDNYESSSDDDAEDGVGVADGISEPTDTESGDRQVAQTVHGEHSKAI